MTITITINGEKHTLDAPQTATTLLQQLSLDPDKVAIEQNRTIISKSQYNNTNISEGDNLEIIHFIGGG